MNRSNNELLLSNKESFVNVKCFISNIIIGRLIRTNVSYFYTTGNGMKNAIFEAVVKDHNDYYFLSILTNQGETSQEQSIAIPFKKGVIHILCLFLHLVLKNSKCNIDIFNNIQILNWDKKN